MIMTNGSEGVALNKMYKLFQRFYFILLAFDCTCRNSANIINSVLWL